MAEWPVASFKDTKTLLKCHIKCLSVMYVYLWLSFNPPWELPGVKIQKQIDFYIKALFSIGTLPINTISHKTLVSAKRRHSVRGRKEVLKVFCCHPINLFSVTSDTSYATVSLPPKLFLRSHKKWLVKLVQIWKGRSYKNEKSLRGLKFNDWKNLLRNLRCTSRLWIYWEALEMNFCSIWIACRLCSRVRWTEILIIFIFHPRCIVGIEFQKI